MVRGIALLMCVYVVGCGDDAPPLEPTYANVEFVIQRSCGTASDSCHGGDRGNANLNFEDLLNDGEPFTNALVGVESCEYSFLNRIEPGDPERSWLFIKLTAAHGRDGQIEFTPDPAWDPGIEPRDDGTFPPSECPRVTRGELNFGLLMPQNPANPQMLPSSEIRLFRDWILAGAPGPE
ncbi:MAG: hypothetical protein AAGE52_14290 [Myxococcota bacterium]